MYITFKVQRVEKTGTFQQKLWVPSFISCLRLVLSSLSHTHFQAMGLNWIQRVQPPTAIEVGYLGYWYRRFLCAPSHTLTSPSPPPVANVPRGVAVRVAFESRLETRISLYRLKG
jgi:hypothetical protein